MAFCNINSKHRDGVLVITAKKIMAAQKNNEQFDISKELAAGL